eukprot:9441911-Pyramimonas_sp.AAC.1
MKLLLYDHRLWSILPPDQITNGLRVRAFRSICKSAAVTEKLSAKPHTMAPWSLFLVLDQPDLAETVMGAPECMLDAWIRQFLSDHDLRTPEA